MLSFEQAERLTKKVMKSKSLFKTLLVDLMPDRINWLDLMGFEDWEKLLELPTEKLISFFTCSEASLLEDIAYIYAPKISANKRYKESYNIVAERNKALADAAIMLKKTRDYPWKYRWYA